MAEPTNIDTTRVEFVTDQDVLIGTRVFRKGDVGEIPTERLKELGKLVKATDADVTNFSKPADKPKK